MVYLGRFFWFLIQNLFIIGMIMILVVTAFFIAVNIANIFVVMNDGLERRASVILMKEDASELAKFFTNGFLDSDELLKNNQYTNYIIRNFNHKVSVEWLWAWPWENKGVATVTEKVLNIDGEIPNEKKSVNPNTVGKKVLPPNWENAKYHIELIKIGNSWKINKIVLMERIPNAPVQTINP